MTLCIVNIQLFSISKSAWVRGWRYGVLQKNPVFYRASSSFRRRRHLYWTLSAYLGTSAGLYQTAG